MMLSAPFPLSIACRAGNADLVRLLLALRQDDSSAAWAAAINTALLSAAEFGADDCVDLLILHGARLGAITDSQGRTALHLAVMYDHYHCCEKLVQTGDVNAVTKDGSTALLLAVTSPRSELMVTLLLENGADKSIRDTCGVSPFYEACSQEHIGLARLLHSPIETDNMTVEGRTALHAACANGHLDIVEWLLDLDCAVQCDIADSQDMTALDLAAKNDRADIVGLLLDRGIDGNRTNENGETALFAACRLDHADVIGVMLAGGVDASVVNADGMTSFHVAVDGANLNAVNQLLAWEFSDRLLDAVTTPDADTALHLAAKKGDAAMLDRLLDADAALGVQNRSGETAFYIAARTLADQTPAQFLKRGANPYTAPERDMLVLNRACMDGHIKLARDILVMEADVIDIQNPQDGKTSLLLAVENRQDAVVGLLLEFGANPNIADNLGWYPIHAASENGNVAIVTDLVKHGASANVRDENDVSPSIVSWEQDNKDVFEYLDKLVTKEEPEACNIDDIPEVPVSRNDDSVEHMMRSCSINDDIDEGTNDKEPLINL